MGQYIPDDIIQTIKERGDIVDVIGSYLPLKKAGGTWKALCPFHQEKTPSFTVNPTRGIFHCFGCGKGGDVFRFIMDKENVDFPNAAHLLAERYNIFIPEDRGHADPEDRRQAAERADQRQRLYQLHDFLRGWYRDRLKAGRGVVCEYFATRAIPGEMAERFQIGASPDSWDETMNVCQRQGYSLDELLLAGLVVEKEEKPGTRYDRFRKRLMFPIWNEQGKTVGFSARTVEAETRGAKYVNSPENPIFRKSAILYGLHLARQGIQQHGFAIICEGQLDVIAMHGAGFDNALAPQGTAFTEEQARLLKRYTDRVYVAFDSDTAGVKATLRVFDIALPMEFEVKVVSFPPGSDPDEVARREGVEGLAALVGAAEDFLDFMVRRVNSDLDEEGGGSAWDSDRRAREMLERVAKISSPIARSNYARHLAHRLNLREDAVFLELARLRGGAASRERQRQALAPEPPKAKPLVEKAEAGLLGLCLSHGTMAHRLQEELPPEMISDSPIGRALETVVQFTMNGEWENAAAALATSLGERPCPELGAILAAPEEVPHELQGKAFDDHLRSIKRYHLEQRVDELKKSVSGGGDEQTMLELRQEYHQARKELLKLTSGASG